METVKTYTNSELFKLANEIKRSTGCTKKESFAKAKAQLENPVILSNFFDLTKAFNDSSIKTKSGKKAKIICETRGKILVHIYSNIGPGFDRQVKYNLDGSRWSKNSPCDEDLIMA